VARAVDFSAENGKLSSCTVYLCNLVKFVTYSEDLGDSWPS
jgi:hypothetical protein